MMTDDSLQEHLQKNADHADADRADRLISQSGVACIDGRKNTHAVCVPGGSAGMFLIMANAIEELLDEPFDRQGVERLLKRYLNAFRVGYFHSDTHAVGVIAGLHESLQPLAERPTTETLTSILRSLSDSGFDSLLPYLVEPELIGCGHLKMMSMHPEEYGVRPELPGMVLAEWYRRWRYSDQRIRFEVLQGRHAEQGLVYVTQTAGSEGVLAPIQQPIAPQWDGIQLFIHHPQTSAYVLAQQSLFVMRTGVLSSAFQKRFENLQQELASAWMGTTVSKLAPDAQVYRAAFGANLGLSSLQS